MFKPENTLIKNDLILVGGGHSHLMLMMNYAKKPIHGIRITLISNELDTPYSGMIPGYIEGIYSWRQTHIDLFKLSMKLNIRFIHSEVVNISGENKEIYLKNRPSISYDFLSINCGIKSNYTNIKGAKKFSLFVKPISKLSSNFLNKMKEIKTIAFIGGGAAAVELALALRNRYKNDNHPLKIIIVTGYNGLLKTFPKKSQIQTRKALNIAQIEIIDKERVIEIQKSCFVTSTNKIFNVDKCILATDAMAPEWLKKSDINLNEKGFIIVNSSFQTNYNFIFASGDIAEFDKMNLPKAGVYAVRSGKPLAKSIRNYITNKPKYLFNHKNNYLALIGLSNGNAIATKYGFSNLSKFNFIIKKIIDKNFVRKFNQYEKIPLALKFKRIIASFTNKFGFKIDIKEFEEIQMQCRGCAAKVSFSALEKSLPKKLIISSDDASPIPSYPNLFQTIDMINAIITDPFLLGKIAANHSLSDIYAVRSKPISAQMILQLPLSSPQINSRDLNQVLLGAQSVFNLNHCLLNGGHTMIGNDQDPIIGFSITGENKIIKNKYNHNKINEGDLLILTGKLGSGLIFAGINNNFIDSHYQIDVIEQMTEGNEKIGMLSNNLEVLAMTDITGFGLANHLLNLIKRDKNINGLTINTNNIPFYKGVPLALKKGVRSSLYNANYDAAYKNVIYERDNKLIDEIIYDPQTVGGLAFIISSKTKKNSFKLLKENKINYSIIGHVSNINNKIKLI